MKPSVSKFQCSATVFGPRVHSWTCTRNGVVERKGKWYCRQHDPEAAQQRKKDIDAAWKAKQTESDRIQMRGVELCLQLDVEPSVTYSARQSSYIEAIEISFEDAERLVKRLKGVALTG